MGFGSILHTKRSVTHSTTGPTLRHGPSLKSRLKAQFRREVALVVIVSILLDMVIIYYSLKWMGHFQTPCEENKFKDYRSCRTRVCHYPVSLAQSLDFPPEFLRASLCTHIHYSHLAISNNRLVLAFPEASETNCSNPTQGLIFRINKLKRQHNGLKTIASVGDQNGYTALMSTVATSKSRREFADSCVKFLTLYDFDGLEVNMIHALNGYSQDVDRWKMILLMMQLRETFDQYNADLEDLDTPLLLTAAIDPQYLIHYQHAHEVMQLHPLLDYMSVLTFDFHGKWDKVLGHSNPLYSPEDNASLNWVAQYYSYELGVPPKKMVLAISTYGREFKLANSSDNELGSPVVVESDYVFKSDPPIVYSEICKEEKGEIRNRSEDHRVPYRQIGDVWTSYEDVQSVEEKAAYVMRNGFGGVVIWSPVTDDVNGYCHEDPLPLTTAINDIVCPRWSVVTTGDESLMKVSGKRGKSPRAKCSSSTPVCPRQVCVYDLRATRRMESKMFPEDVDLFLCTHLNVHGMGLRDGLLYSPYNDSQRLYARLLERKKRNPWVSMLLTVGVTTNTSNADFAQMASSNDSRALFIEDVVGFLHEQGFQGLDLMTWSVDEPENSVSRENFTLLLQELREALNESLLLTATVRAAPEDQVIRAYDIDQIHRYVDFLNLMTFDFYDSTGTEKVVHHSPLFSCDNNSVAGGAELWVRHGAPKRKLVLGISLSARALTLQDSCYDPGCPATPSTEPNLHSNLGVSSNHRPYCGVCHKDGMLGRLAANGGVPFLLIGKQWISFDDVHSVTAKACYARTEGYGGVMAWKLEDDDFNNLFCGQGTYPLWDEVSKLCHHQ